MNSIKKSKTFTGRISEGKDEMIISTDDGFLVGIGSEASNVAVPFDNKRAKITITVEIEEM